MVAKSFNFDEVLKRESSNRLPKSQTRGGPESSHRRLSSSLSPNPKPSGCLRGTSHLRNSPVVSRTTTEDLGALGQQPFKDNFCPKPLDPKLPTPLVP